jgi:ABC-type sugar transport system ATPase subunit
MNPAPCLDLRQIVKRFPGVVALDGVDFDVRPGEVHALVGENGAGKSTLIKIACGLYQPDAGEIILNGEALRFHMPHDARDAGIAVIHQEVDLFPDLSVTENLLIGEGLPTHATGWIRWREARSSARSALGEIGEELDEGRLGLTLSAAERQVVAIASALSQNAKVIIMDEPTASLAEREVHILFQSVERLREKGVAVIYITHRLEEVFRLANRVTVLRDGKKVWTRRVGDGPSEDGGAPAEAGDMVRAMVGREVRDLFPKLPAEIGEPVMRVAGLTDSRGAFHEVSFEVRAGEILGLYGLIGAGRSEAAQGIFGLRETIGGSIDIAGKSHQFSSPREALDAGIAYVPEDRLVQGLFLDMKVRENSTIAVLGSGNRSKHWRIGSGSKEGWRTRRTDSREGISRRWCFRAGCSAVLGSSFSMSLHGAWTSAPRRKSTV